MSLFYVHALLNIAVRAAREAGEVIIRSLNRLESLTITSKGRNDFVSEVDHAAEAEIIKLIRKNYPSHAFLAEESGRTGIGGTGRMWLVDPLCGTLNYAVRNVLASVNVPPVEEIKQLKAGAVVIGFLRPLDEPHLMRPFVERNLTAYAGCDT